MNTKLEKYINYIATDIIKNTDIDWDLNQQTFHFPWKDVTSVSSSFSREYLEFLAKEMTTERIFHIGVRKWVEQNYGTTEQEFNLVVRELLRKLVGVTPLSKTEIM